MERFLKLPFEKQSFIIDAALKTFSKNGYKKTSVSDIAAAAGISKAMIFHYFGTKKALYIFLIYYCRNIITKEVDNKLDYANHDFFERIRLATAIKISILKKHPAMSAFLTNMYFEEAEDVREDIKTILSEGEVFRNTIVFESMDYSKFKEGIDLKVLMKMFSWISDGFAKQMQNNDAVDFDALNNEFEDCLKLLENNFYKEEYVK